MKASVSRTFGQSSTLDGLRQSGVPGGSGEHVAPRAEVPVEFSFDRIEKFGHVLILIYQDWLRADDESSRIIADSTSGRRIVTVDDDSANALAEGAQPRALAHHLRPIQLDRRLLAQPAGQHRGQSSLSKAGK